MTKPQPFNIIKQYGQLNKVYDPSNGKTYERTDLLFVKLGDNITFVSPVYDPDHFIYQRHMPITEEEVRIKYMGVLPRSMRGPNIMCTCGAEAVVMIGGEFKNQAICKSLAQFGKHQTSFTVKDGVIYLDKNTEQDVMLTDDELKRGMRSQEEEMDLK